MMKPTKGMGGAGRGMASIMDRAAGGKPAATGLARAAAASGRTMPTTGKPAMTGLARAAAASGRTMPTTGKPATTPAYSKGGKVGPRGKK
jgi:hypothetical protein